MNDLDIPVFKSLFKEAAAKCFGHNLESSLGEGESKLFANEVLDKTGLVIGWKSIKNYSAFVTGSSMKDENPSLATLDTLARYVTNAPYTNEADRKNNEGHYPYWFSYREKVVRATPQPVKGQKSYKAYWYAVAAVVVLLVIFWFVIRYKPNGRGQFTEHFTSVNDDTLAAHGWFVQMKDDEYWNKRGEAPGCLSLFTLRGDNWPDSVNKTGIKNLLLRNITQGDFMAEVHLKHFIPSQNWQQAGILLLEDTNFTGKSLRFSLMYNNFAAGFPKTSQIIVQAFTSTGNGFTKPEEITHEVLFNPDSIATTPAFAGNLENIALRIEKTGDNIRLLYSGGLYENGAFKELAKTNFDFKPKYVGLFALKGFIDSSAVMPARFTYFGIK